MASTTSELEQIDKIASIRGWFKPKDNSPFYATIQEFVNGESDLASAISKITAPIDEAINAGQLNESNRVDWMDLWYSVIHASKRISYRDLEGHNKLIAFMEAFQKHPMPSPQYDINVFESLQDWPLAQREALNDSPGSDASAEINAWANYNYFLARLTSGGMVDAWICAIWAMRSALEKAYADHKPEGESSISETARQKYDALVPAAAVWVFGLGNKLFEKREDLTPNNPRAGNPAKGGELWTGGAEFSKERWSFWKKRFSEVAKMEDLKEETREVAKDAFEAMEKAESQ